MDVEGGKIKLINVNKGANSDVEPEFLGAGETGEYLEGRNLRTTAERTRKNANQKIKGESVVHGTLNSSYYCNGTAEVKGQKVKFWAHTSVPATLPAIIQVDGVTVLSSTNFPITASKELQIDTNDNCVGGEIYITDNNVIPMIFNIQDMIDSLASGSTKYFADFDVTKYTVNLSTALDIPVFIDLVNTGGGAGLPPGSYSYAMRYVTKEGDRTNVSQSTPPIPVVQNLSSDSHQYPFARTFGGPPNPSFGTNYAIKLRFRVTNTFDYDFIELIRFSYNQGGGLNFTPPQKIIARIPIAKGEISVREFFDPVDSNTDITVTDEELTRELAYVKKAKGIRYFDKRLVLMNVELASKKSNLTVREVSGQKLFPIMEKLGKAGHNNPYIHTYKKSYMGGEQYGIGVTCFDGVGGKFFTEHVDNINIPNRRDVASATTKTYSYHATTATQNFLDATSRAATSIHSVDETHEVFDLYDSVIKTDACSFKNIYSSSGLATTGFKDWDKVDDNCPDNKGQAENRGANVSNANKVYPAYHPYKPTSQNDNNVTGHNYRSTVGVDTGSSSAGEGSNGENYIPKGFAPNYYAKGIGVGGFTNFPEGAKAFSISRTDPAGKVVCQGIGMYELYEAQFIPSGGNQGLLTKATNKSWFYSPDIASGIVSAELVNDMISNPQNYKVQFVSPLGFFSEVYGYEEQTLGENRDRLVDMMVYARMIRDEVNNARINPTDNIFGIQDGSYNYVSHRKWRNSNLTTIFDAGNQGNNQISLTDVERKTDGRNSYLRMSLGSTLYVNPATGGTGNTDFEDPGMRNFHEPLYIVNIIRVGAEVRDDNIKSYRSTGHYQKLESIIGESDGTANQKFILVDERWEDCIPGLITGTSAPNRYVYIKDGLTEKRYINITFKSASQIATINADIAAGTSGNHGTYTHENDNNRFFTIVFGSTYIPANGSQIIVKYDNTVPIRVFGGDTTVGEALFAPIDRESDGTNGNREALFAMGAGFPFRRFKLNPRHYVITRTTGLNRIQNKAWTSLGYIRQMALMFCCESRTAVHYAHNGEGHSQHFPLTHYVMRPNRWKDSLPLNGDEDTDNNFLGDPLGVASNNIFKEYADDYGTTEKDLWRWGGIRIAQQFNVDYSAQSPKEFFSMPLVGFTENLRFCTRTMHSLPRAINAQNVPGLKTFPANNAFDISDEQGEIKMAWSAASGKGDNLYAILNTGVCLLLTKKSVLSDLTGGELGYMAADSFITGEYWLSKFKGCYGELWRGAAEGSVPVKTEGGSELHIPALVFPSRDSVYRLMENQIVDIGKQNYHTKLRDVIPIITDSMHIAGHSDINFGEYWLHVENYNEAGDSKTFCYSHEKQAWQGYFDYKFDKFLSIGNKSYGMRDLQTYELNSGFVINGQNIIYELTVVGSQEQFVGKEFMRVRVNSYNKPTDIEFYDTNMNLKATINQATQGQYWMKNYNGYEGDVPRDANSPENRVQGRALIYKIIHNLAEDFTVVNTGVSYKILN